MSPLVSSVSSSFGFNTTFPKIVTNRLVLHLDAGQQNSYAGIGTVWADLSGRGNTGTLQGGATYSSSNGGSIVFDGTNDYVELSDIPFRFSNTFTLSIWFYWNGVNVSKVLLGKRKETSQFDQYNFSFADSPYTGNASNKITFFARRDNSTGINSQDVVLQYALPSAGYYNVCATMGPLYQALYVNGILRTSSTKNISSYTYNISNKNLRIANAVGLSIYYGGNISQVTMYNKGLTEAEVQQNFQALRGRYGI